MRRRRYLQPPLALVAPHLPALLGCQRLKPVLARLQSVPSPLWHLAVAAGLVTQALAAPAPTVGRVVLPRSHRGGRREKDHLQAAPRGIWCDTRPEMPRHDVFSTAQCRPDAGASPSGVAQSVARLEDKYALILSKAVPVRLILVADVETQHPVDARGGYDNRSVGRTILATV
eukprot:7385343-Prymnesium_polylepis.3